MSKMSQLNEEFWRGWHIGYQAAKDDNAAEPIVHCKDCKYWHDPDENKWGDCYEWGGYSEENGYCSWGERREE